MPLIDKCGIFGISSQREAAKETYLGLCALQHRGQESAGICARGDAALRLHKGYGLVADVFSEPILDSLPGNAAIGQVKCSGQKEHDGEEALPFIVNGRFGQLAACYNGTFFNADRLRNKLMAAGYTFSGASDAEVLLALVNTAMATNLEDAVEEALQLIEGAYSLLILSKAHLIGAKDPWGMKPLAVGQLGEDAMLGDNSIMLASESCAFDLLGAKLLHELEAGEMLILGPAGLQSRFVSDRHSKRPCVFELVHFARPDSFMLERTVMAARREWGRLLALRHPADADIVVPVPDSGVRAALGYSEQSGIRLDFGIVRSHYAGRKFIEPKQGARSFGEKMKLNPVREILKDKRVVLVDDCIASGGTCKKLVGEVRAAGAVEVHLRISSPPIAHNCFYGVGGPTREHLIASHSSIDETKDFLGADTLAYLDIEDLQCAIEDNGGKGACYACFNGDCPIPME